MINPPSGLRNGTLAFFGTRLAELAYLGDPQTFEPPLWTTMIHDRSSLLRGAFYNGVIYTLGSPPINLQ